MLPIMLPSGVVRWTLGDLIIAWSTILLRFWLPPTGVGVLIHALVYHCLPWSSSGPSAGIRMSSVNVIRSFSNRDSQSLRMEPQNMWPPQRRRLATKFVSDRSSAMTLRKFPSTSDLSSTPSISQLFSRCSRLRAHSARACCLSASITLT